MRALLVLLLATSLVGGEPPKAGDIPPSPSSASGERIWPDPRFTHWPPIVYEDESRNLSFELPVRQAGVPGSVGWEGGERLPFTLDADGDRISGLIPAPTGEGDHVAEVTIADRSWKLPVRLADVREPWPLKGLVDGFPVDEAGRPVLLIDRRRDPAAARKWKILSADLPRSSGRALIVGDPMEAYGDTTWSGLDAEQRIAHDERYPHHAALVALATLPDPLPRTLIWSPGNQALFGAGWSPEEERVLAALLSRLESSRELPRLVLVLPPVPIDEELRELAVQRRELLTRSASFLKWTVIDVERLAGPAEQANRIADQVFTRYPNGEAQARVRAAIAQALTD
ncbi:MAG TPA: hypothetical protein VEL07_13655 [Planctomycetota bacterium]|nr:hypothetical protein [Planctomycetota bacterium]